MKTKLLLLFAVLCTGCKKADTSSESGQNFANYRIERTDGFANCEYLAVVDNQENKSTPSNRDVFKIDKDGNMTAMAFYFAYKKDENGNTVKKDTCANIKVIPKRIESYLNEYTCFFGCSFYDEKGVQMNYGENGLNTSGLVIRDFIIRNRDGAIFEGSLPMKLSDTQLSMALDKDKNLYYLSEAIPNYSKGVDIFKFWADDKKGVQQQINPKDMLFKNFTLTNQPGVLVAGTIVDGAYIPNGGYVGGVRSEVDPTIIFPNGGFKKIKVEPTVSAEGNSTRQNLICVGDAVKLITVSAIYHYDKDSNKSQYECKFSSESIKTANHTYTKEPERSGVIPLSYFSLTYNCYFSFNCQNHYVFGMADKYEGDGTLLAVCDHNSSEIRFVKPEKFPLAKEDKTTFSNFANRIGNVIFRMNETTNTIDSYDFETLTYKEVPYDDSALGGFHETGRSMTPNPATIIRYGTRGTDGSSVVVETDVITGKVKIKELGDNRSFTTLVRLD